MSRYLALAAVFVAASLGSSAPLAAQVACSTRHPGNRQTQSCTVVLSASLQIPAQATLTLDRSSTDLTGGQPLNDTRFRAAADTGLTMPGPMLTVYANRGVSVSLVNAPRFLGPAVKPASDVHLGVSEVPGACGGVALTPLSTSPEATQQAAPRLLVQSPTAVSDLVRQLCLRVWWRYASDAPGSYALPLTISVTAP